MLTVSELYIYPIKSLGGIALPAAALTDRGFEYDRRWMLVDENNRFLSQREVPVMACLHVSLHSEGLLVINVRKTDFFYRIPFQPASTETIIVSVWGESHPAQLVSAEADAWFSEQLDIPCRLVYMPDSTRRLVDENYAGNKEITSFSDGYPLLIIGQASLDDLNSRLSSPLPMNRFRPNIVFTGGTPFQEDDMKQFGIGDVQFFGVKPCARCVITTTDQETAVKGKEPLKTLSTYRNRNNKIYFGQNLLYHGSGTISVGDTITFGE
ncbi:MOSC domain-containing protein [Chitinophaga tropicalis]|uniref:MOSC domain-containing protein n=1 Tax=Chitinophaga tropicalis TaxID=2683588 RepID=A0A7K1UCS9_9BACT|nr:MOSC N-terminal beta barrel domain-containing protein [Chitinophaga tropicalis]MVT12126.1 MOSC domain-containing protein [Chitinophaga tropicalis]